jgi:polyribonucleotide nucleotidyltransferase
MQHKVTAQIGSTEVSIETGKIAKLADGSVVVSTGDTMVLVSAVSATQIKEGQDWFPLTVDYREKAAAVGKFPGGYLNARAGLPRNLTARMTDRPPVALPAGILHTRSHFDLLSADGGNDPDILAINGLRPRFAFPTFHLPVNRCRAGKVSERVRRQTTRQGRGDLGLVYSARRTTSS